MIDYIKITIINKLYYIYTCIYIYIYIYKNIYIYVYKYIYIYIYIYIWRINKVNITFELLLIIL